jgi:hypothetical protein
VLRDGVYISDGDLQMKMEGVYIWPFRQLRMVLTSSMDSDLNREDFVQSSPYHLVINTLVWILQVLRFETCCLENFLLECKPVKELYLL